MRLRVRGADGLRQNDEGDSQRLEERPRLEGQQSQALSAVAATVRIHQSCLCGRGAVEAPGSSGGNPTAGAREKTMNPPTPQRIPRHQSTSP